MSGLGVMVPISHTPDKNAPTCGAEQSTRALSEIVKSDVTSNYTYPSFPHQFPAICRKIPHSSAWIVQKIPVLSFSTVTTKLS